MPAHAGDTAWMSGTFRCQQCDAEVRVRRGQRIPRCPNGHSAFDERIGEDGGERLLTRTRTRGARGGIARPAKGSGTLASAEAISAIARPPRPKASAKKATKAVPGKKAAKPALAAGTRGTSKKEAGARSGNRNSVSRGTSGLETRSRKKTPAGRANPSGQRGGRSRS